MEQFLCIQKFYYSLFHSTLTNLANLDHQRQTDVLPLNLGKVHKYEIRLCLANLIHETKTSRNTNQRYVDRSLSCSPNIVYRIVVWS